MIERETSIARELLKKGQRQRAMLCLKKKKFQLNLLEKSDGQLSNIEQLVDTIESQQMNVQIMNALKEGNVTLNQIEEEIGGVEAIEDLLAETQDAIERQNEMDEALSQTFSSEDEDDLLAELASLQEETEREAEGQTVDFPSVPQTSPEGKSKVPQQEQKEEKEKQAVLA